MTSVMNPVLSRLFLSLSFLAFAVVLTCSLRAETAEQGVSSSPSYGDEGRKPSPGNVVYYVNPETGDDARDGLSAETAKRTASGVNGLLLSAGDVVRIAPGRHVYSFDLRGKGTEKKPIVLDFLPGKHDFAHGKLVTDKLQISNTNDAPQGDKALLIRIKEMQNVRLKGAKGTQGKSLIRTEGKAVYIDNEAGENVDITGLSFDYIYPTMGEFTVEKVEGNKVYVAVPEGISYKIEDGKLTWYGPGWSFGLGGYAMLCDPEKGSVWHYTNLNGDDFVVEDIGNRKLILTFKEGKTHSFQPGLAYQNRNTYRDCCGFFQNRSKNIRWEDCTVHYIHGLGVVSQFSENISYKRLKFEPAPHTAPHAPRTVVSWADCLHFSGCRGKILVTDSTLGYAHDDPINVHGTHLRIVEQPDKDKLVVRFMHGQTFGFPAFTEGDEIDYVNSLSMRPYASNKVKTVRMLNEKDIELTLERPNPGTIQENDVIENVTWTPSVHIKGTTALRTPTRGFLLTTRRPILVENCTFIGTGMSAILSEGDALFWFESGVVRDMTIAKNRFIRCGEPVIKVEAPAKEPKGPVHRNVKIEDNRFDLAGGNAIWIKHTADAVQSGNEFVRDGKKVPYAEVVHIEPCPETSPKER